MTRAALLSHLGQLEEAARTNGLGADVAIGEPALESEIAQLEAALGVVLPRPYRKSLSEWSGCTIEIRQPPSLGAARGALRGQWEILDVRKMVAATTLTRRKMACAMEGSDVAGQVAEVMSRIIVVVFHDDICVFLTCGRAERHDLAVRCMNLEYALGEFPPTMYVIATSPDDFLEKCFAQFAKTLETEIYWW